MVKSTFQTASRFRRSLLAPGRILRQKMKQSIVSSRDSTTQAYLQRIHFVCGKVVGLLQ
jgi:hypothetical protein